MATSTDDMEKEMTHPIIKTTAELRSFMTMAKNTAGKEGEATDENLIWFVNIYNAKMILDSYSTKDIASMLQGGVLPTDKIEHVQEFIDTFYEDVGDEDQAKLQSLYIIKEALLFWGLHESVEEVDAEIEAMQEKLGM